APHLRPLAFLPDWHVPAASQYCAPSHITVATLSCEPAAKLMHTPSLPATLQPWHVPRHALLQQTESTQKPLPQSAVPLGHALPFGFLFMRHEPEPLQYWSPVSHGVVAL